MLSVWPFLPSLPQEDCCFPGLRDSDIAMVLFGHSIQTLNYITQLVDTTQHDSGALRDIDQEDNIFDFAELLICIGEVPRGRPKISLRPQTSERTPSLGVGFTATRVEPRHSFSISE